LKLEIDFFLEAMKLLKHSLLESDVMKKKGKVYCGGRLGNSMKCVLLF